MKTIALKIDVTKIEKERLFEGKKGKYLDAVIIMRDTPDEHGNWGMIVQSVTKEERAAGKKGNILGNCKVFGESSKPDTSDDLPWLK